MCDSIIQVGLLQSNVICFYVKTFLFFSISNGHIFVCFQLVFLNKFQSVGGCGRLRIVSLHCFDAFSGFSSLLLNFEDVMTSLPRSRAGFQLILYFLLVHKEL